MPRSPSLQPHTRIFARCADSLAPSAINSLETCRPQNRDLQGPSWRSVCIAHPSFAPGNDLQRLRLLPCSLIAESAQLRNQHAQRPRTVAQNGFDRLAQFRKRLMVFGQFKERIITESSCTSRSRQNPTGTGRLAPRPYLPKRIRQHRMTNVMSRSPSGRHVGQFLQQQGVVRFIRRLGSRLASRIDARSPPQRVNT